MKKIILLTMATCLMLFSCEDANVKKQEEKVKDANCKLNKMLELQKYDNIMVMALDIGMKDEYSLAFKSFSDTSLNCSEANKNWDIFMLKYDSVVKLKYPN